MKKLLIMTILLSLFTILWAQTDDYIFFDESPSNDSYDPSWGYVNAPSLLERVGEKFPVDTDHYFQGQNSLRLSWTSNSGGDWGIAVAGIGWPGRDINQKDTLSFYVYSDTLIASVNLPLLYLEDLSNQKTDKIKISDYIGDITADEWYNVRIPLQPFKDNSGQADLTRIKTLFYGQDVADAEAHIMYLDEIRMVSGQSSDTTSPAIPENVAASGYEKHVVIEWDPVGDEDLGGYNIYRAVPGGAFQKIGAATKDLAVYSDYHGLVDRSYNYKVMAVDMSYNESGQSEQVSATTAALDDEGLLDMVQESTFRFFWNYAHPVSGLSRERYPGDPEIVTSGGSGMGMMTIPVAIERGFITREEGVAHILKILTFLKDADRFHGAWSHWLNGSTGAAIPFSPKDDGGDIVETAYVAEGLLTVRQYFNLDNSDETQIRAVATELWESIEWDWYRRTTTSNMVYWHWSPNYGWEMNMPIYGFNECMIVYLLAIASPTHPVPASLYEDGWAGQPYYENGKSFYGIPQYVGWDRGGPLFFTHYSFLGFDPRGIKDSHTNYYINNRNISLINRAWCIDNPGSYTGYSEDCWGLTASDDPFVGYMAHEPTLERDNGTITPTAALSTFPYTPTESMQVLKYFYRVLGEDIVGPLGFKDAFNQSQDWVAGSYIAIDQGPIIVMIENYRSGLLWENFMANPEIQSMLDAIGFVTDTTTAISPETDVLPKRFTLCGNYPNPFNPGTKIRFEVPKQQKVEAFIYNLNGQLVKNLQIETPTVGNYEIYWNGRDEMGNLCASGIYLYRVGFRDHFQSGKMLLTK
ncbi:MAG: T9SS type A sorting domain-containing protein [Candidatus Marinimicrobia bacterium]|nr:T9SS type A sorting domain-containing protein [Candidatus Neomarinimicrobiota bacterium]